MKLRVLNVFSDYFWFDYLFSDTNIDTKILPYTQFKILSKNCKNCALSTWNRIKFMELCVRRTNRRNEQIYAFGDTDPWMQQPCRNKRCKCSHCLSLLYWYVQWPGLQARKGMFEQLKIKSADLPHFLTSAGIPHYLLWICAIKLLQVLKRIIMRE